LIPAGENPGERATRIGAAPTGVGRNTREAPGACHFWFGGGGLNLGRVVGRLVLSR
jgi:hypothetical protein